MAAADAAGKKGGRKKGLLLGLAAALVLGGGGFYATYSGAVAPPLASGEGGHGGQAAAPEEVERPAVAFLPLEPILVSVGRGPEERRLQFAAQIEVAPEALETATALKPRAIDVLTTYLRAVSPDDVENPASMLRMRAQMLRRLKVVMGEAVARDLLVGEFILR